MKDARLLFGRCSSGGDALAARRAPLHSYHEDIAEKRQVGLEDRAEYGRHEHMIDEPPVDAKLESAPAESKPARLDDLDAALVHAALRALHRLRIARSTVLMPTIVHTRMRWERCTLVSTARS